MGEPNFHTTAKVLHRQVYFEAYDFAVSSTMGMFEQPGYNKHWATSL